MAQIGSIPVITDNFVHLQHTDWGLACRRKMVDMLNLFVGQAGGFFSVEVEFPSDIGESEVEIPVHALERECKQLFKGNTLASTDVFTLDDDNGEAQSIRLKFQDSDCFADKADEFVESVIKFALKPANMIGANQSMPTIAIWQ